MENEIIELLPVEIKDLALKVNPEKQKEVQVVLNQIFAGTADWEKQVDLIEVKDVNDKMSIQLADTARKNAKQARLNAEKIFDAKRDEVQIRMSSDKLEDALWLKSKQIMQLKFKHIEEKAEFKANYVQRYEAEQKKLRTEIRLQKVLKFNPGIQQVEIENLSDEMFNIFLSGIEKTYNDKIEAERKAEAERIQKEKEAEAERQRIIAENERLKKEQIESEKKAAEERKKQEAIIAEQKKKEFALKQKADAERKIAEEKAKKEKEIADAKLKAEKEKSEKLQAALKQKAEAERIEKERIEKEKQKALKAPDKQKIKLFATNISSLQLPEVSSKEANHIILEAKKYITKLVNYLEEKSDEL